MTTATRSVAVVATRLPIIDRRALSQAWYSALHITQSPKATAAKSKRSLSPDAAAGSPGAGSPGAAARASTALPAARVAISGSSQRNALRANGIAVPLERRSASSDLSRRIERAFIRHVAKSSVPSTLAINLGEGRVHLLVRNDGKTTRIVALCAPHLRERVDRALAQARFALAAAGTRIEAA